MTVKTVTVKVYVDDIEVGSGEISYDDESYPNSVETIVSKTLSFKIYVGDVEVGEGDIGYDDYVAYGDGGSRTINLTGAVLLS